ncbi:glycoside hydrolase family 88 protein [Maribellus sediminis]|uniref:glycoside hydrolase family 88 protein n=1 Tax=Maribellus sediminis TaxID=2696285 RepID=UPI001431869F|nr:glycoside hydrolase family 88 protein [Maribellus sediminis]
MKLKFITGLALVLALFGCSDKKQDFITANVDFAEVQLENALKAIPEDGRLPRSIKKDGQLGSTGIYDWTSGFFSGSLWYLYELSGNEHWHNEAERTTVWLEPIQYYTDNHDVGFMLNCSFGNGLRLTDNAAYKQVLINGAESLCTRYSEVTKTIKSWNGGGTKDGNRWQFPVIIDNMMNLDLLFEASKLSGNEQYRNIAITHAETTMKNHFRDDFSSYHVVDYDTITGEVRGKYTHQGYSHESAWARGQAWGLYGFTLCYRETGDERFLNQAEAIADYMLQHPNLPEDMVPLWDYHVNDPAYVPSWLDKLPKLEQPWRDASAAAITSSALFDLSKLSKTNGEKWSKAAEQILFSLGNSYKADPVNNPFFVLDHSVGNIPSHSEIDVPLNYADYYFLEALARYKKLEN